MSQLPSRVGVYGGGRMGAGIAHAFLLAGCEVTVVEVHSAAAEAARSRVDRGLEIAAQRGEAVTPNAAEKVTVVTRVEQLRGCELVIEAVPEDADLKVKVLRTVEKEVTEAALATNTSSLSISQIGGQLRRPEAFIGLHFFNPVPTTDLVEVVVGEKTSSRLVAEAQAWVEALGKTAITVADAPGFASSRLGVALALEAMRMVEEEVASPVDIDTAMTLGYRHPVGPLRTTDMVGLDVRLAIAEHLAEELGERFTPPSILREKVAAGELGRKAGRGFFTW